LDQPRVVREPCTVCGRETAAGSILLIGRVVATRADGSRLFACGDCVARVRAANRGGPLTALDLDGYAATGTPPNDR
jgi:hypothetical protein